MCRKVLILLLACLVTIGYAAAEALCFSPIHVNPKTGKDLPTYGKTARKPVKSIQYALSLADGNTTIFCAANAVFNESVIIDKHQITLRAKNPSLPPTINGSKSGPAISIKGPVRATIQDFIIQNGTIGVSCDSARVELSGSTIRNNGRGIDAEACNIVLSNSTITTNTEYGMYLRRNSTGKIENTQFSDNLSRALYIKNNAQATILSSKFQNNGERGIACAHTSSVQIEDSEISGNKGDGVSIAHNSSAYFGWEIGTVISGNGKAGVQVSGSSSLSAEKVTIQGNGSWGAVVGQESSFILEGGTINNNGNDGVLVYAHSIFYLNTGTIDHNTGDGIEVQEGSVVRFYAASGCSVTENGGYGIRCGQGGNAWSKPASLVDNTLGECFACSGICP